MADLAVCDSASRITVSADVREDQPAEGLHAVCTRRVIKNTDYAARLWLRAPPYYSLPLLYELAKIHYLKDL